MYLPFVMVSRMGKKMKIGFIGLGLIGGSLAKALHKAEPAFDLIAYDINHEALKTARDDGVINKCCLSVSEEFADCDFIFLCAPVTENDANLSCLANIIKDDAILTDVGSVKANIHKQIAALGLARYFIGGHPMAGSEKTGYENARADLFENAYYMITPGEETTTEQLENYRSLVAKTGAIPLIVTPEKHDYATGAISHLPHVIAAALVNLVRDEDKEDGMMKMIAAGGFRDITRIASSSPKMWEAICMTNADNLCILLDIYIKALLHVRDQIAGHASKEIYDFFDTARIYRDSFAENTSGPIRKVYAYRTDIPDVPGSIARIAAILGEYQISIRNIGINHNREDEEGVLRIEFYDADAKERAGAVLRELGYRIYDA